MTVLSSMSFLSFQPSKGSYMIKFLLSTVIIVDKQPYWHGSFFVLFSPVEQEKFTCWPSRRSSTGSLLASIRPGMTSGIYLTTYDVLHVFPSIFVNNIFVSLGLKQWFRLVLFKYFNCIFRSLFEGLNSKVFAFLIQGVDIQLGIAIDSSKATLAVKRRLSCEMVKYWQQVILYPHQICFLV